MSQTTVTDHAVLRWLERVEGYDIERLRADIARSGAVGVLWNAKSVIVGKGKLVLDRSTVVTVLRRGQICRALLEELEIELPHHEIAARHKTGGRRRR